MRCSNEAKHRERFAVRAKYMTLEPTVNKYVKYIRNIRTIQVGRIMEQAGGFRVHIGLPSFNFNSFYRMFETTYKYCYVLKGWRHASNAIRVWAL